MPIKQTAAVRFLYQGFTVHRTCKRWADAGAGPDVPAALPPVAVRNVSVGVFERFRSREWCSRAFGGVSRGSGGAVRSVSVGVFERFRSFRVFWSRKPARTVLLWRW